MVETIILMRSNMQQVAEKTGIPYHQLYNRYIREQENNNLIVITINENGTVSFSDE
jgi:hypothetical protein